MEYPGSRFTKVWRRIILGLFVLAFFIISPIIVVYTTGYKYDWKYGFLRETGNVSIDVLPKNANAYLDGLKIGDNHLLGSFNLSPNMPIRLKNITPHTYHLLISAPGYYDWDKDIEVADRQTVYIKEIELLQKNKPEELVKGKFNSLFVAPSGAYILYSTVVNNQTKVILHNTASHTNVIILTFPTAELFHVEWSERTNFFALYQGTFPLATVYVVNADKPESVITVTAPRSESITKLQWHATSEPELYYSTPTNIYSYHPELKQLTVLTPMKFVDWYVENDELWTIETNTSTTETTLFKDTLGFKNQFALLPRITHPLSWHIRFAHNGSVLTDNADTSGFTLVRADTHISIAATHFTISPYNSWWLLWSSSELWTYSEGDEPKLLNRSSDEILTVGPLDQYNTLAISWARKTIALFPYYLVQHDLLTDAATTVHSDPTTRSLYFIDKSGLWKLSY